MSAKLYVSRALKYFLKLLLLVAVMYLLLFATGSARVSAVTALQELFSSWKGYTMIGLLLVIAATYPMYGFVTRRVEGSIADYRETILDVFYRGGYSLKQETEGKEMLFKAFSAAKQIWLMGDDKIVVRQDGDGFTISGVRKDVVAAEFRMHTFMNGKQEGNED